MSNSEVKIKKKFKGITHILEQKNISSRGLWTKLQEKGYNDYKTYDLFWWITTGARLPKDASYYILVAEELNTPLRTILECYSNRKKSIFN